MTRIIFKSYSNTSYLSCMPFTYHYNINFSFK